MTSRESATARPRSRAWAEDPGFWTDNVRAQALLKEKAQLEALVGQFERVRRALDDAQALHELAEEAGDEAARAEAARRVDGVEREVAALEFQRMLSGAARRAPTPSWR